TSSPNATFSNTVRHGKRACSWNTIDVTGPTPGTSSNTTRPRVGGISPARMWSRVDLPQPDGPSTVTNSPASTVRLTSWSAWTARRRRSTKVFDTPSTRSRIDRPRSVAVEAGQVQHGFGGPEQHEAAEDGQRHAPAPLLVDLRDQIGGGHV